MRVTRELTKMQIASFIPRDSESVELEGDSRSINKQLGDCDEKSMTHTVKNLDFISLKL